MSWISLNQIKADLGGLWILVGVSPLLWLRTAKIISGFGKSFCHFRICDDCKSNSFVQEGLHPISIVLLIGEHAGSLWFWLLNFYLLDMHI